MTARHARIALIMFGCLLLAGGCAREDEAVDPAAPAIPTGDFDSVIGARFGGRIDLDNLANYANQAVPAYITRDNSGDNPITDEGATLGRVLFYDKLLSTDQTISCASCHQQQFAFSDGSQASAGVGGVTGRHSMRLVNIRFGDETRVFWDERAVDLEDQATQPIRDHIEMGFSGLAGNPDFGEALSRMAATDYYPILFTTAFGDPAITEPRIQLALAQFVRSIQSFDSRYDAGRALVPSDNLPFPNLTPQEAQGKGLFMDPPVFMIQGIRTGGGLGCAACHNPPEFGIDPNSLNNGVTGVIAGGTDLTVTRAPSLRNLVRADGGSNGGLMHTGDFDVDAVLEHYNRIATSVNPNLDPRLLPGGSPQFLNLTQANRNAVAAFLRTLAGSAVYSDPKWSDPFGTADDPRGNVRPHQDPGRSGG